MVWTTGVSRAGDRHWRWASTIRGLRPFVGFIAAVSHLKEQWKKYLDWWIECSRIGVRVSLFGAGRNRPAKCLGRPALQTSRLRFISGAHYWPQTPEEDK